MASKGGGTTRYWVGVLYPENMISNWQDDIESLVQLPFAYCIHDQDLKSDGDCAKTHVHLILAWPNTTTQKQAEWVFQKLQDPDMGSCLHKVEQIINMQRMYDYLIHDTDDARRKGKYQYSKDLRIEGNGFDIHFLAQTSASEKAEALRELRQIIKDEKIFNVVVLMDRIDNDPKRDLYEDVVKSYTSFVRMYLDGIYQLQARAGFFKKTDDDLGTKIGKGDEDDKSKS